MSHLACPPCSSGEVLEMVEQAGLENRCTLTGTVGSNPPTETPDTRNRDAQPRRGACQFHAAGRESSHPSTSRRRQPTARSDSLIGAGNRPDRDKRQIVVRLRPVTARTSGNRIICGLLSL